MHRPQSWVYRASALGVVGMLIAACGTGSPSVAPGNTGTAGTTAPESAAAGAKKGGTLYLLQPSTSQEWNQIGLPFFL